MGYLLDSWPLLLWFGLGIWGWWIAWGKFGVDGKSKAMLILAAIFMFFFGIVTLAVAAIFPPIKVCPLCFQYVDRRASVCKHCHGAL